jgi:hypothetical protein
LISENVLHHLGDLALLVLWLDDGTIKLHDGNGRLCLQSFSRRENRMIMEWLRDRCDANSRLTTENEIFMNSKELVKLLLVLRPLFVKYRLSDCMRYKLGAADQKNAELVREAKENRRKHDRARYRRIMMNPTLKAVYRKAQAQRARNRLANPSYRAKYNKYHKVYERKRRNRNAR